MVNKQEIKSLDDERYSLAALLRFPAIYAEISNFIDESDYTSKLNRTIFSAIKEACIEGGEVSPYLISTKLLNLGVTFEELNTVDLVGYLEELKLIQINELAGLSFFKNLKKMTVRREIFMTAGNIQKAMKDAKDADIDTILDLADKLYSDRMSLFVKEGKQEFRSIYSDIQEVIEDRGNNPITEFGFYGPFDSVNSMYDALYTPHDISLVAARSNSGKTSFGLFYSTFVADKYQIPILHIDANEMSLHSLQIRQVCALTKGKVPTYYLKTGLYRQHPEMVAEVKKVWPRVKNLKVFYKTTGNMSSTEICSMINRFYLSHIGRFSESMSNFGSPLGPLFPVNYDYFKPVSSNSDAPEWIEIATHLQNLKTLISDRCPASIMSYLQLNRTGITRGKVKGQYDDSEGAFSMSDRLYWLVSQAFLLRTKTMDELAEENQQFGNCVLKNIKRRDLGKDFKKALTPVRCPDGSLQENYIHLNQDSFYWEEKGTLEDSVKAQDIASEDDSDDGDVELR